MRSVEEALSDILADLRPTTHQNIALDQAVGRVLSEDVYARRTHPEHDISAMDGYAVRASDLAQLPYTLRVIEEIPAGTLPTKALGPGEASRIFTGATLPQGADTIALQEDVDVLGGGQISVRALEASRHVRTQGLDFKQGALCIAKGTRLSPAHIGLLAAANVPFVNVHVRPRITLLSTGSELVLPGQMPGPGQIISSNGVMLSALIERCGGQAIDLGPVIDDEEAILAAAEGFNASDICVTIGGASVGKHDLVQDVLSKAGLDVSFWKIAMRPGKPLIFGSFKDQPFLGLPGNPVSAFVCALLFLCPAIRRIGGEANVRPRLDLRDYKTLEHIDKNGFRKTFLRAQRLSDKPGYVSAAPIQDSSMLSALAAADCLIVREPDAPAAKPGDTVSILSLT